VTGVTGGRIRGAGLVAVVCLAAAIGACGPAATVSTPAAVPAVQPIVLPSLDRADASVQTQVRERHRELEALLRQPGAAAADTAAAYGALGVLLHAGEYYQAAEPAYQNARMLTPDDPRWPYFLSLLHRSVGRPDQVVADLTRVLALRPDDVPALIWLGRMYLDQGEVDKAEPLFARAQAAAPRTVAVLAGLGQCALARRDHQRAAGLFEQALELDPSARSLHSPLAQAYRALGDTSRAEAHLAQWKNVDVLVPDPLRLELDLALQSGLSYELRGVRALEQRDFKTAAGFFRQGIALAPGSTMLGRSLRHKLGTALFLMGDAPAAVALFEETVKLAPATGLDETASKAHYSLGVLALGEGRTRDAATHLSASVRYNPNYVEALSALGDLLRQLGRYQEALPRYQAILELNPQATDVTLAYGLTLVRLRRYREARDWLAEASGRHPDDRSLAHALARLLAAAPAAEARDGARAVALAQRLLQGERTTPVGETLAMALAEIGDFDQALAVQRGIMAAADRAGLSADVRRMAGNLRKYERRQPCRTPWSNDEPRVSTTAPRPAA
jgi:tetratricopeptide (TPR) repeat protein